MQKILYKLWSKYNPNKLANELKCRNGIGSGFYKNIESYIITCWR